MKILHTPWLAVVPCDLPCLPVAAIARLAAAVGTAPAAYARSARGHSLLCLLHQSAAETVDRLLNSEQHRVEALFAALDARPVPFTDAELHNLNTPADLAALPPSP